MGKKIVGIISFMNSAGAQEALLRLMTQLRLRGHDIAAAWGEHAAQPAMAKLTKKH